MQTEMKEVVDKYIEEFEHMAPLFLVVKLRQVGLNSCCDLRLPHLYGHCCDFPQSVPKTIFPRSDASPVSFDVL